MMVMMVMMMMMMMMLVMLPSLLKHCGQERHAQHCLTT